MQLVQLLPNPRIIKFSSHERFYFMAANSISTYGSNHSAFVLFKLLNTNLPSPPLKLDVEKHQ